VFRWPIELTAFSMSSRGASRTGVLDVTPRGALFTLAALAHIGHPAHLALIDAYLKGQMRLTPSTGIGEDAGIVLASLGAPLVAAHELGMDRLSLRDLVLLPRSLTADEDDRRTPEDWPVRGPDSPRLLVRSPRGQLWVQAAEWFELAGCAGTPQPGVTSPWWDVIVSLPRRPSTDEWFGGDLALPPIEAELREATAPHAPPDTLVASLRAVALGRWARAATPLRRAAAEALKAIDTGDVRPPEGLFQEIGRELHTARVTGAACRVNTPSDLVLALSAAKAEQAPSEATFSLHGLDLDACRVADLDGYHTICLLPPPTANPATVEETMRELAWDVIEALIGRPLPERRTEPIAISLHAEDGRSTTLDVGSSIVIGRNQQVFAGWVGSDGRVMLRLFPPGGVAGVHAATSSTRPPPA
jgi:hypothetical protein